MRPHVTSLLFLVGMVMGCGAGGVPAAAVEHDRVGAQLLMAGRLDQAEARFRLALEYRPRFAEPHANLGLVALARGHLPEAERELRLAVELNEDFATAWGDLGVVLEREDRPDDARAAYEKALSIDPAALEARRSLALLLAHRGLFVESRAHLLRYLELSPDDAEAEGALAWCELRLNRPEAADERATALLARAPDAKTARLVRGMARAARGDLDAAAEDLYVAAEGSELGREARLRLATVQALRGRVPEARTLVTALLRDDENDAAVQLVAATVALASEDAEDARRHAERAVALRPELVAAHVLLARACALSGDLDAARAAVDGLDGDDVRALRASLDR